MYKPVIRLSRGGFAAVGLFSLLVVGAFAWIFFIASKNPADSGESGILLLFFAMPWISLLPSALTGILTWLVCLFFNALILYFVFGGLRMVKTPKRGVKNKTIQQTRGRGVSKKNS